MDDALDFVGLVAASDADHRRRLYACPTGTGKGTMQLALLLELRAQGHDAWILTPALEVLRGSLERCGVPPGVLAAAGPEALAELGRAIYVTTPTRHQNGVLRGEWGMPDVVIYDEAHHAVEENEVSGTLFAMAPDAIWLGFTATPYRGTPSGTLALRDAWGEPILVMDIPEAIEAGHMARPTFEVVPLIDDDQIKVVNGKFQTKDAAKKVVSRLVALADKVEEVWGDDGRTEHPIVVTVPSTEVAGLLVQELEGRGIGARLIVAATPEAHRAEAYRLCEIGLAVIVSVKVLTEGVDLPWLEVLLDARPTTSPVDFVQRLGRIMRPKLDGRRPRYICCCRNLERFAYLLGGAVPPSAVKEAQEAFEAPSKREGYRSLGFEGLAKFKRIDLPLLGGIRGAMFNVHQLDSEGVKTEWCVITTPLCADAVVARRHTLVTLNEAGERDYSNGRWKAAELPSDLAGFATSQQTGKLSASQAKWWDRSAERVGLDPGASESLKRRQFQALPVLSDLKINVLHSAPLADQGANS